MNKNSGNIYGSSSVVKTRQNIRRITVTGILSALTAALSFTPFGFILVPVLQVQITIMHIPVIIGAILEGPVVGAFIGLLFGLFSLYTATYTPLPIAFAFLNPLVSVLPRILIGVVTYYVYKLFSNILKKRKTSISIGIAAFAGTLTNTVGVLGMIYILYARRFLDAIGLTDVPSTAVFGLALPNSPLEIVAAILLTIPVVITIKKMRKEI